MLVLVCSLLAQLELVADVGELQNGTLVVDTEHLWFADDAKVMRIKKAPGSKPEQIATLPAEARTSADGGDVVFFASRDAVWSVSKKDGAIKPIVAGLEQKRQHLDPSGPGSLLVDGGDLYVWAEDRLLHVARAGGAVRTLESGGFIGVPNLDESSLYYASGGQLRRASRSGGVGLSIIGDAKLPGLDNGEAFIVGDDVVLVRRKDVIAAPRKGGAPRTLVDEKAGLKLRSAASDGAHLYLTTADRFLRLDVTTGALTELGKHPAPPDRSSPRFGMVVVDEAYAYTVAYSRDHAPIVRAPRATKVRAAPRPRRRWAAKKETSPPAAAPAPTSTAPAARSSRWR